MSPTARERARAEITKDIKAAARRQIGTEGASTLSLRAIARELGFAPSALYRYFASRDELLTALIIDAYDDLGAAAESADAPCRASGADAGSRWLAVARAIRGWALAHPHEFALIYGSPVPGYRAPADTVGPATRGIRVLATVLIDGLAAGQLEPPRHPLPEPRLVTPAAVEVAGGWPPEPHADLLERTIVLWAATIGTVSYELFGHLYGGVTDYDSFFDAATCVAGETVGLVIPIPASSDGLAAQPPPHGPAYEEHDRRGDPVRS